jgi:hypothetical protein
MYRFLSLILLGAALNGCQRAAHVGDEQTAAIPASIASKRAKLEANGGPRRYDQPREAAEYFVAQREAEPGAGIDPAKYLQAQAHIQRMPAFSSSSNSFVANNRAALAAWSDRGPSNVAGRTRVLRFRPGTPSTLYAAAVAGGLWRSTDTGATWAPLGDLLPNISITAMAIDPNAPDTMYIGGGEGFLNVDAQRGLGIFKSTDGGITFAPLSNTFNSANFRFVNDLVISSENSNVLYATTNNGLWRSLDAGVTWVQQINGATGNGCHRDVIQALQFAIFHGVFQRHIREIMRLSLIDQPLDRFFLALRVHQRRTGQQAHQCNHFFHCLLPYLII